MNYLTFVIISSQVVISQAECAADVPRVHKDVFRDEGRLAHRNVQKAGVLSLLNEVDLVDEVELAGLLYTVE